MKRRAVTALLAAACVPGLVDFAVAKPAAELTADALADRVQEFYDKTKTFKAGFDQVFYVRSQDVYKKSKGQVVFQKPGKMSWRYSSNGNRVVSDGKIVKVFEKDNKQMYEQAIDKSAYPAALSFLVGGGSLRKEFKLKKLEAKQLNFEGGYVLLAVPKKPTAAYQKMLLYVDAGTYQVRRVLILDAQGNRNRFDFVKPSVNVPVLPAEFDFRPPPGTQLVKP
ncbi:MAG TPA: outer membrane lipoprotein carrier protein LolA [Polyangiaceae bacterium]|jgi:outer membrane lipoprotein carrier protein